MTAEAHYIQEPGAMIEHHSVEAMVSSFDIAMNEIERGYALLETAQNRLKAAFEERYNFDTNPRDNWDVGERAVKYVRNLIHRAALRAIVEKLQLRPVLSDKRWRELSDQIDRGKLEELPQITTEGIQGMVEGVAGKLASYFAEAVDEVFNYLRPPGSRLKTNTEFEVGRKAIVSWAVERGWHSGKFRVRSGAQQSLCALDNVFHYLDGKPAEGSYKGALGTAIELSEGGSGETEYFKFKCYGNGHLHLQFLRMDLVKQLNAMAGGKRLKPRQETDEDHLRSAVACV